MTANPSPVLRGAELPVLTRTYPVTSRDRSNSPITAFANVELPFVTSKVNPYGTVCVTVPPPPSPVLPPVFPPCWSVGSHAMSVAAMMTASSTKSTIFPLFLISPFSFTRPKAQFRSAVSLPRDFRAARADCPRARISARYKDTSLIYHAPERALIPTTIINKCLITAEYKTDAPKRVRISAYAVSASKSFLCVHFFECKCEFRRRGARGKHHPVCMFPVAQVQRNTGKACYGRQGGNRRFEQVGSVFRF